MSDIRIYSPDEPEYKLLQSFCDYLNEHTNDRYRFYLDNILFDAGTDQYYTAIITEDTEREQVSVLRSWQAVTPRTYVTILQGEEYFQLAAQDVFEVHTYTNPPSSAYDLSCVNMEGTAMFSQRENTAKEEAEEEEMER